MTHGTSFHCCLVLKWRLWFVNVKNAVAARSAVPAASAPSSLIPCATFTSQKADPQLCTAPWTRWCDCSKQTSQCLYFFFNVYFIVSAANRLIILLGKHWLMNAAVTQEQEWVLEEGEREGEDDVGKWKSSTWNQCCQRKLYAIKAPPQAHMNWMTYPLKRVSYWQRKHYFKRCWHLLTPSLNSTHASALLSLFEIARRR